MKAIDIGSMKTIMELQTNIPKLDYGSGRRGAGYLDTYTALKRVRGKKTQFTGSRALNGGDVVPIVKHRFVTRMDTTITNHIDKQMRFIDVSDGEVYTLDSWKADTDGRATYLIFELLKFGK